MYAVLLRFVVGGLIVASVPVIARRLGADAAALLGMVPVTSIPAYYVVYTTVGPQVVHSMAAWGLVFIVPLAVFYIAVLATSGRGLNVVVVLAVAVASWALVAASAIACLRSLRAPT